MLCITYTQCLDWNIFDIIETNINFWSHCGAVSFIVAKISLNSTNSVVMSSTMYFTAIFGVVVIYKLAYIARRPGAKFGRTVKIFADQWLFFWMTFLRKKCPFSRPKFLMTFFVIDHNFWIFPILFKIFHIFDPCNAVYGPFFTRKTLFQKIIPLWHLFLLASFFRTHPTNTTSQNIGGTDAWAFPQP